MFLHVFMVSPALNMFVQSFGTSLDHSWALFLV